MVLPPLMVWQRLRNLFRRLEVDEAFFAELEATLLAADVGPELTRQWMQAARKWKRAEDVDRVLRGEMLATLSPVVGCQSSATMGLLTTADRRPATPLVIMIVGVNGVGKTTTIAKLAHYYQQQGKRPLLVAGDTFRAAAIEQLKVWADRLHCPIVAQHPGADAAAVAFDGVTAGLARKADLVIVDTAGRLHTKSPLMEELKKVKRVMGKACVGAPPETWCILDATIGQNAISQVKEFHEAIGLTGLVLTKLDGTAKAGAIFTIARTIPLPIHFIGRGETVTDLVPFAPESFVDHLLMD